MRDKKEFNRLDRALCQRLYNDEKTYDSLFCPEMLKHIPKIHANFLFNLECFVDDILSNDEIPFVLCLGANSRNDYDPAFLAQKYFGSVPDFIDVVNMLLPNYDYSELINVFISCCRSIGLLHESLNWIKFSFDPQKNYLKIDPRFGEVQAAEIFNTLVKEIRSDWRINKTQIKVNERRKDAEKRYLDYCKYIDSLFDDRARLLVLRVDLFYKKQHSNSISISDMQKDLASFFKNQRHNSLFDYKKGYIVKLEYGIDKGFHWHLLFFFDGSERKSSSHIHLAEGIGEYWINAITKGRGDYWNVNNKVDHYEKLERRGIGVINWNDDELRKNLKERVVHYLCKIDQFIKPKSGKKVKLIRRGLPPKKTIKKLGRPRKGK